MGYLLNATKLREMLDQDEELSGFPIIDIDDYTDIRRISEATLSRKLITVTTTMALKRLSLLPGVTRELTFTIKV